MTLTYHMFLYSDKSDIAVGYRKQVNGWSYCNFTMNDVNAYASSGRKSVKITDGKYLYSILSSKVSIFKMGFEVIDDMHKYVYNFISFAVSKLS